MLQFEKTAIKDLRDQKGLSQLSFARMVGTSKQMLDKWEKGDCTPNVGSLLKICRTFDLTIDYFFVYNDACVHHTNDEVNQ